jgi:hypothetical protein
MKELAINSHIYFDDITHSYLTNDGEFLIGVTSLMRKHGLSPDYSSIPEDVLQKAAERGSKVHKDIELYCKGQTVEQTTEVKAFKQLGIPILANEYLISDNTTVASSIDIVADSSQDGYVDLIDIKTTSTLHNEPLSWQLSIYAYLFEQQNPTLKVNMLYGLHIRGGKAKMVEVARKPDSEIERLMQAEREGKMFIPSKVEISRSVESALTELKDASTFVASLKAQLKAAEDVEKAIKQYLLEQMEKDAIKSLENDQVKIVYVAPSERESIDKDKLKEKYPSIYEEYKKVSPIASNLRIKIK